MRLKSHTTQSLPARRLRRVACERLLTTLVIAVLCVEYRSPPRLRYVRAVPAVYAMINGLPPGIMLEYPTPSTDSYPRLDADYTFWSTTHWRPLINGYSGYVPASFWKRVSRLERFPSDDTLADLRALHVRYVVVHPWAIDQPHRADVLLKLAGRDDLQYLGTFWDWYASAELFELLPVSADHRAARPLC